MVLNNGYIYKETLDQRAKGHTVLSYLVQFYPHSSQEAWQQRLDKGEVQLNNKQAHGDEPLHQGDSLVWHRAPWYEEDIPRDYVIIYQDEDMLVINKPSGLPTMPAGNFFDNTLFSLLRTKFPTASPLHRLGRGTSGLVVFSLNRATNAALAKRWREHRVTKLYLAIASGVAEKDGYTITQPIGEVQHPILGKVYAANEHGKASLSLAKVLKRGKGTTLFEVEIKTGRPHQIRIHLASIGHPLVGDRMYGVGGLPKSDALPGDGGYFLHAQKIEFLHPKTHKSLILSAPLAQAFNNVLVKLNMQTQF